MKKVIVLAAAVLAGLFLAACQSSDEVESYNKVRTVSGTLAYRERIALPTDSLVTVTLQDISLADAPAKVIAKHRFEPNGSQVPFNFDLIYHTSKIDPRHRYSVSARIEINGQLRFITDTVYPAITDSANTHNIDLKLVRVAQ